MNMVGLCGYYGSFVCDCDCWFYVDMYLDLNWMLNVLCEEMKLLFEQVFWVVKGYDVGWFVVEGLVWVKDFSCEGVKVGFEQVKWFFVVEGEEGILLGFGIQDCGVLYGCYLVLWQWLGGWIVEVVID